jgi:hypothetical protein
MGLALSDAEKAISYSLDQIIGIVSRNLLVQQTTRIFLKRDVEKVITYSLGGLPKFYWDCQQDVRYFGFETQ